MSNEWLHESDEQRERRNQAEARHRLNIEPYADRPERGIPWGVLLLFALILLFAGLAIDLVAGQLMSRP